ncbi:MAG TPA: type IV toxin-antitoxin system AbiEi family antitoxin domain-containing protein [Solirubrobacteraceae bacterium]|nr:type IV toxin-antitoxin system AbiEi family antitoxin domain-containing protein [Solirubrobacteraceae bacterium]
MVEAAIALIAGRQHGYITRAQLLALGMGRHAITYRVEIGRLIAVYTGVYAVGYVRRTPEARACAAVLACGDKAALSHGSAASLWGFNKHWDEPFEVIAPSTRRRKGIKVHRCRTVTRWDITRQLGIRVTTPARTVLDNAPRLAGKRLSRFVNDALRTPYLHAASLADVLNRNPDHPAAKRLLRFVEDPKTNSPLEDDFVEFARRYGLPAPVTNTHLLGYEIDVLYPRERVIVEVDSHRFHSDRDSFERDRKKDAVMLEAGFVTVRITDERMEGEPEQEANRLLTILAGRRDETLTVLSNCLERVPDTGVRRTRRRPAS